MCGARSKGFAAKIEATLHASFVYFPWVSPIFFSGDDDDCVSD